MCPWASLLTLSSGFFVYEARELDQTISEVPVPLTVLLGNSEVFQEKISMQVKLVFPYCLSVTFGIKPNISLELYYNI